jgi:hypothetical protein
VDPRDQSQPEGRKDGSKRPEEANENIRKSQGDDAADAERARKTGNKPAFDRDR